MLARLALFLSLSLCLGSVGASAAPLTTQQAAGFQKALRAAESALAREQLPLAKTRIDRALERDPKSIAAWDLRARWAEASGNNDELVYSLHRALRLSIAQKRKRSQQTALRARLLELDPQGAELLTFRSKFIAKLEPIAAKYEKDGRPHSAISVHKEILALDPDRTTSADAIQRLASAPDPSLAEDAQPADLLEGVSEEFIREHDEKHHDWSSRAKLKGENYTTYSSAGYEMLLFASTAMEQMNAFYRIFFRYGTEEDGSSVPPIDLHIYRDREEYLEKSGAEEWTAGFFDGAKVVTYDAGTLDSTANILFHEAAHQFVSLATNASGWLNEGLASFFEGTQLLANGTVRMNMPANHRLFPLVQRMNAGWMSDAEDGIDSKDKNVVPAKSPTFRIVLENRYVWGPAWYAPTWGVVYYLYNYQDPFDGRFVYRRAFQEFINTSGGRMGEGAVRNFEEVVLENPAALTPGLDAAGSSVKLPRTVEELDPVWKEWLTELRRRQSGSDDRVLPYDRWAGFALRRGDFDDAEEFFEKGIVATPEDADLSVAFAEFLADKRKNYDRALKLARRALRIEENEEEPDNGAIRRIDELIAVWDPAKKPLFKLHQELRADALALVRGYMKNEMWTMAMAVSKEIGTELDINELWEPYERALRQRGSTLDTWRLAYNENDLKGWDASAQGVFKPRGELLDAQHGTFDPENFEYRFLTLDQVTSGDFSMEAEFLAESGDIGFCGLVFGRKSETTFHGAVFFPPRKRDQGLIGSAYVDLTSFYGDTNFKTWRHEPVDTDPDARYDGAWHKIRIDVIGTNVDLWVDDAFVTSQEFASLDLLRGNFGLMLGRGKCEFRNVRYLARPARDPGAQIEREFRMSSMGVEAGEYPSSWIGKRPPFPPAERWFQAPRSSWEDKGPVPTLFVLWSIQQNDLVPVERWLTHLSEKYADVGLEIVSVCSRWDMDKLEDYLGSHAFPGSVAADNADETVESFGDSFEMFSVMKYNLPRLLLLDVDHRVIWEGDPGFASGRAWEPGTTSYVETPIDDLIAKRRLREITEWRRRWLAEGLPALRAGDPGAALGLLETAKELGSASFDAELVRANRFIDGIERAVTNFAATAEVFQLEERDPALLVLLDWAKALEIKVVAKGRELKKARGSRLAKAWPKVLNALGPAKALAAKGAPIAIKESARKALEALPGRFPSDLFSEITAAEGDDDALGALIEAAEQRPAVWLANEYFGLATE